MTTTAPHPSTRQAAAAAVNDAAENVAYWKRQALLRIEPHAIATAKGLASVWESTRKARQKHLDALSALVSD
jgi:hypothetical protein